MSNITPFTIDDVHVNPAVVVVQIYPNIACNTSYTGTLSASVSEGTTTGVTTGYLFEWFSGENNTNMADFITAGPTITGLQEGDYTVRVTDQSTPGTGCIGIATLPVERKEPVLNSVVTATPQTLCAPTLDGGIVVDSVRQTLMGTDSVFTMTNPAHLARFSFQWFDAAQNPITAVTPGNASSPALDSGTYYVEVTDSRGCLSNRTVAVIEDETDAPVLVLDSFTNPSVCIQPEETGKLTVIPDNTSNLGNYTFQWYEGNSVATGSPLANTTFELSNISYTDPTTYTIRVTNNTSSCFSDASFRFETDTVIVQTLASAVPLTSCIGPNGSLFASTARGVGSLYDYDWYIGTVMDTVDFQGSTVLIAPVGIYTAIAKHPTLTFCTILPDTAFVSDGRVYPPVTITPIAPLTYCDPAKSNGAARADVNGRIIGYTFEWFEGSLTNAPPHATGSEANNLRSATYFVNATDLVSGCENSNSITIENDPVLILPPQIELVSNRTDCEVPNGELSVSVNGNTSDYTFLWYNGTAVKNQHDAIGELYWYLEAMPYTATATDLISGCVSAPATKVVGEEFIYPEFEVETVASICNEENGTATVIALNGSDIRTVEWDINGTLYVGPDLFNVPATLPSGTYLVTAITSLNCKRTEEFIVKTEINVYNAISKNNDNQNEFFEIGCIENYPRNNVRIFNRAGMLVYENKGYNNQDVAFNGISNKGINLLGDELPDGTYFYIIDKGDGTKPRTGYLELLH
jgi:gliding motility-associated-like protein